MADGILLSCVDELLKLRNTYISIIEKVHVLLVQYTGCFQQFTKALCGFSNPLAPGRGMPSAILNQITLPAGKVRD